MRILTAASMMLALGIGVTIATSPQAAPQSAGHLRGLAPADAMRPMLVADDKKQFKKSSGGAVKNTGPAVKKSTGPVYKKSPGLVVKKTPGPYAKKQPGPFVKKGPVFAQKHPVVYRSWHRRPYYGRVVAGVVIGTILAASAYYALSGPPDPDLCWYWANPSRTRGYWDYCDEPPY